MRITEEEYREAYILWDSENKDETNVHYSIEVTI